MTPSYGYNDSSSGGFYRSYPTHGPAYKEPVYYVLSPTDAASPVATDFKQWLLFMAHSQSRVVASDTLEDGTLISTVFLGTTLATMWQTAVFGGPEKHDGNPSMYHATWADAMATHASLVREFRGFSRAIRVRE